MYSFTPWQPQGLSELLAQIEHAQHELSFSLQKTPLGKQCQYENETNSCMMKSEISADITVPK